MITTLIICATIVIITAFICSVYVNIKRHQIDKEKESNEYKNNCIYTKDSAVQDIYHIKSIINKLDTEYVCGESNKNLIELIRETLEDYTDTEIN